MAHFHIVGVDASTGELEARRVAETICRRTRVGFVLVQHLGPQHESALTQLLTRAPSLSVREVTKNLRVEANRIHGGPDSSQSSTIHCVIPPFDAFCGVSKLLRWSICARLEFPPQGLLVWTTDGNSLREGKLFFGGTGTSLKDTIWKDTAGAVIKVTHWLAIEPTPKSEVAPPKQRQKGECRA